MYHGPATLQLAARSHAASDNPLVAANCVKHRQIQQNVCCDLADNTVGYRPRHYRVPSVPCGTPA